jgi:hypothetical protein
MQRRKIQADCFDNGRLHQSGAGDEQCEWENCFHIVSHLSGDQAKQHKRGFLCEIKVRSFVNNECSKVTNRGLIRNLHCGQ